MARETSMQMAASVCQSNAPHSLFAYFPLLVIFIRHRDDQGGDAHVDAIRNRPRPQRSEFPAADPVVFPGARGRGLSGNAGDHPWRIVAELSRFLCARQT